MNGAGRRAKGMQGQREAAANARLIAASPQLLDENTRLRAEVAELRGILADCRAAWVRTDDGRSLAMAHAMKRTNTALARTGTPEGGRG